MLVICNGMMRSGSTLQYNIASSVLKKKHKLTQVGFMEDPCENLDEITRYARSSEWYIIKTHAAPCPEVFYQENVHILYSYRDVRDIAASMKKKWPSLSFEQILISIDNMISIKTQFEKIDGCLMQSYDLLYNDLKDAIYDVSSCLDVALDEASCSAIYDTINVESIVKNSRISDLKTSIYTFLQKVKIHVMESGFSGGSLERSRVLMGFSAFMRKLLMYDKGSLMHHNHISSTSGRNGDWVNVCTPQEVETLQMRYKGWLKQHGYF